LLNPDLVRRLEIMAELSEWDGNTGRAARMALQIVRDYSSSIRGELYAARNVEPDDLGDLFSDRHPLNVESAKNPFDIVVRRCRGCGEEISVTWRFGFSGSASSGVKRHVDGCLVPLLERMLDEVGP
jgi:hypothetical protein